DHQDLSYVYSLERKALQAAIDQTRDKPDSAIENIGKLKHILKQKKQIAGILSDQQQPAKPTTINIQEIKVLWEGNDRPNLPECPEGEVVSD
ncbi:MAG: hypothetical protein ACFFCW_00185, partial [Candidatus Hodarchaeota archaeon]